MGRLDVQARALNAAEQNFRGTRKQMLPAAPADGAMKKMRHGTESAGGKTGRLDDMSKNPYQLSDRAAKLLNRKAVRRFEAARRKCVIAGFDELNVIKTVKALYRDLAADNKKAFTDLAIMAYEDAADRELEDEEDELMGLWLMSEVLDKPNPVTGYIYTNEVERKRDRATESINSSTKKRQEFQKALKYWSRQTAEYCDIVTDEATLKAFKDTGVKKVKWITERDDRVCPVCGPRDGKVYDIDKAPSKPHLNCRCILLPVKE